MFDEDAIVITGVGVLTPLGNTFADVGAALRRDHCSILPCAHDPSIGESLISDFEPTRYAEVRGMRVYNRTTQLAICAGRRALQSAYWLRASPPRELGVVMASTFGHLDTLLEYDGSLARAGVRRTNPALMPLSLASASAAATALALEAEACAVTLAGDAPAALDALALAARLLAVGRARACVVVAAFSPLLALTQSARAAGKLASAEQFVVLDRSHAGTVFGEAAVAFVLERDSIARTSGGRPLASLRGHAAANALTSEQRASELQATCDRALQHARVAPRELALVSAGSNGTPAGDDAEALALRALLGEAAATTPMCAVKGHCGEAMEAGGLLQVLLALSVLESGFAPAIRHLKEPCREGLGFVSRTAQVSPGPVLISATSEAGPCSALVVDRPVLV
ncbi:MAG: beta-ketoacyl synthase N-terminal-like domain-containing protein [Myxococcales bacterium]